MKLKTDVSGFWILKKKIDSQVWLGCQPAEWDPRVHLSSGKHARPYHCSEVWNWGTRAMVICSSCFQLHLAALHEGRVGCWREHDHHRALKRSLCCREVCWDPQGLESWPQQKRKRISSNFKYLCSSLGGCNNPCWRLHIWSWWLHWEGQWVFWPSLAVAEGLLSCPLVCCLSAWIYPPIKSCH